MYKAEIIGRVVRGNMGIQEAKTELRKYSSQEKANNLSRFFKTGPGEYGEGDRFIGVKVPEIRKIVKLFQSLPISDIVQLLQSPIHEERLLALLLLVESYRAGDASSKKAVVETYLQNSARINSWDLVDLSASQILGDWLKNSPSRKNWLDPLVSSKSVWERRISIVSTYTFIRDGDFSETLRIADRLMRDSEDLIYKAVGWMLREVGKRDEQTLDEFLRQRYQLMPRTMLRYAIERMDENKRQVYLFPYTQRT
jgi:3-methyladenine DNA glycosylase AlkD